MDSHQGKGMRWSGVCCRGYTAAEAASTGHVASAQLLQEYWRGRKQVSRMVVHRICKAWLPCPHCGAERLPHSA
jgi:hypothetical protein